MKKNISLIFLCWCLTLSAAFSLGCRRRAGSGRELTMAINSGVEGDALKAAAKDYEKQTGIHINIVELPYANLFEKELVAMQAKTGAYDVVMLDDPWFPKFAESNALTDLDALLKKRNLPGPDADFVAPSLALCKQPYKTGTLMAFPYVGNSQLFFYRKDLFANYQLPEPKTWTDVLNAAKTIDEKEVTGAPGGGKVYGYVMRAAQGNAAVADFMPIFWAFGAEMFDAHGQPTVNSPEGIEALKFMVEMGKLSPPGYASFNADEVSAHLLQGTAAMSINWPAWIPKFEDATKSKVLGKVEFTTMPGAKSSGTAEIGNWLLGIPRDARNADAALDFILWATAATQMKQSAIRGNPPTRKSVFTDVELVKQFPAYPAQLRSLENSRPRPRTAQWNEIENVFGIYLSKANSGLLSPEDAMNQANAAIGEIVARAGQSGTGH